MDYQQFLRTLAQYYTDYGRHDMAWRQPEPDGSYDPYKILVSELMLQQTQVPRVAPKYDEFMKRFPTVASLAAAELGDVLKLWSGLGYNRRAKFLWQAAQAVANDFGGEFPKAQAELVRLPGVGPNTAGAILAYAYDQPVVFIETNVRTVIIHHFLGDQSGIPDTAIREILEEIIPEVRSPREFYWAMMDYGTHLKKSVGNLNKSSKTYKKQSKFHGSRRQIRGAALRLLGERSYDRAELLRALDDDRAETVVDELIQESLIIQDKQGVHL
jgi:A/G-specific adenine glycosylase